MTRPWNLYVGRSRYGARCRHADLAVPQDTEDNAQQSPNPERFGPITQKLHDWHVIVGAGASFEPEYEGSNKFKVSPIPFVSATFFDRLTIDPTGVDLKAYEQGPFQFDLNVGYDAGRSESDSRALHGMGDIDFGVTVGGRAAYNYGPASFFVSADKIIGGSDGFLGKVGVEVTQPLSKSFILGAGASATFADKNYMESYFGVDSAQSARSGYQQYKAGAGVKSVDLSVSATYLINDHWTVRGEEKVSVLVGNAADSPIVQEKVQPKTMLMLGYRF